MQPRRPIWWAILALVTVDILFFSGASNYLPSPQARILTQLIMLGVGVAATIGVWRGRVDTRSPLVLPGLAYVGATIVAALTSQRPEASLEALALLLLAVPTYLAVRTVLADPWFGPRVDWLLIGAGFVFTVAYLLQALTQWVAFWSVVGPAVPPLRPGDVGLTVGTVNAVALYLELLVPVGLCLAWSRWRSTRLVVAYAVVGIVAMVITGSRGAWLGTVVGLALFASLAWMPRGDGRRTIPAIDGRRRPLVLGGLAVAGLVVVLFGPTLLTRLAGGDAGRLELWDAAWSMFTGHPVSGVGPGAWPGMRPLTPISEAVLAVLYTSHSIVLQVLAELGILGGLAAGWLAATVAWTGWRAVRSAATPTERVLRAACLASLAAFAVHSLVDSQVHIPAVAVMLMLLMARLAPIRSSARATETATADTPRRARLLAVAVGVPVLVGVALLVPIDVAMIRAQFGNGHLDRGETAAALADFDAAVALHDLPVYRLGQAIALDLDGDRDGARAALERMATREPFTFVRSALASVYGSPIDVAAAEPVLAGIERDGPYDATATLQVAVLRAPTFETKDDLALAPLTAVMTTVPSLIHSTPPADTFSDATWATAQQEALVALTGTSPSVAAAEAIQAGLPEPAAAARLRITDPDQQTLLDLLQTAVDTGSTDTETALAILRANPEDLEIHQLVWAIGFAARSQPTIDAVATVYGVVFFGPPQPPMEIVLDGAANADWSVRLPRYPMAAASRLGPKRPYLPGLATIEPVYRPK